MSAAAPQTDTTPPPPPRITGDVYDGQRSLNLTGTAEAHTTVTIYDNGKAIGTTLANTNGDWSYTTGWLRAGAEFFTATATNAAGTSKENTVAAYLPDKSERLQLHMNSDRAAFAFDTPTLSDSPNRNREGNSLLLSEGSQSGVLALLGNYMASSFAVRSHDGGTLVVGHADAGNHSLLASPHRT